MYPQYGAVYAQYGAVYARRTGEYAPFQQNVLEKCSFFINYAFLMLQKADYAKRNASIMGLSLHTSFLKTLFGDLGRLSSLELATEPSPLHSADGSSTASI